MNRHMFVLLRGSLANRAFSLSLIVVTLAFAVALYVGVQNVQRLTRASFENSISGVDLVVAARGADVQILLNTVFGLGASSNLISDKSVEAVAEMSGVSWVVPLALGDSHRGFRVLGTAPDFFEHVIAPPSGNSLFAAGTRFDNVLDAVIGADVAEKLDYKLGDKIVLKHGVGEYGADHDDLPFVVHGILAPTGTPFDRAVLVSVEAIEVIHRGWRNGQQLVTLSPDDIEHSTQAETTHDDHHGEHHEDEHHEDEHHEDEHHDHASAGGLDAVDAVFVGLTDRRTVVRVQRAIAEFDAEPLSAVIPGVTLAQIWQIIGVADRGFRVVSLLVIVLVLLAMTAMTVLSTDSRRREMAILRALGASPRTLVGLILAEALLLSVCASALGLGLAMGVSAVAQQWLTQTFGLSVGLSSGGMLPGWQELMIVVYLVPAALVAGLVPALRVYRRTVQDGIMVER